MPHHQITVIGPIASGKTTVSQFLSQALHYPLLDADLFETNPFLPLYTQDQPRWSFATELFFTLGRLKKLRVLPTMLKHTSVVVDSGLIMSHAVYTKNHLVQGTMTAAEWDFFSQIVADYAKTIPSPDLVIHLLASPATQLERIKLRGRSFEANYTLEYLSSLTDRLFEYSAGLSDHPNTQLFTFDTESIDLTTPAGQSVFLSAVKPHLT